MNKYFIALFFAIIFFKHIIFLSANNDTYINTSNIIYDEKRNIVELADNSKININNTNVLVDRGVIDYEQDKVEVFGNFYLYQDLNILSGRDLVGDTSLKNFSAFDVSYIYNNDLKIDSDKAKRSENLIYFYNNFITPCELEGYFGCPTWSLRIDETKYNEEQDKFSHFDTFLQIADYKVFYLPYFSHYGAKAPRKRGFLTPTLEFNIGGNSGVYAPYYLPIKENTEVRIIPKFIFSESFDFINNYNLRTVLDHKMSGGNLSLDITNIKNENDTNINTSARMSFRQVLDRKKVLSFNGLVTNSISTTRSINEDPLKFENIYLKLENYDLISNDDFLKAELTTVEAFDSTNVSLIPFTPNIIYRNNLILNKDISNVNEIFFSVIKRDESKIDLPSENSNIKINNYFFFNNRVEDLSIYNKFSLLNSYSSYKFGNNNNINRNESFNHFIFSSDLYTNLNHIVTPRIKFILNKDIHHSDGVINEDSDAISFNYQNSFSDNRFFGTDLRENTSRIVYGFESKFEMSEQDIEINISQSYDLRKNNNFSKKLKQYSNISDIAIEGKTNIKDLTLSLDTRLDKTSLENKETNIKLSTTKPLKLSLNYNETSKNAFLEKSDDTEYLGISLEKKINDNLVFLYNSNIDLKNNFSPYYDRFGLKIFDECSQLNINYSNRRYSDNYNTTPEEMISISFNMDYLGFFGYQQTTDLFLQEPGNFDYGL